MKTSTEQKEKTMSFRLSVSEAAAIQGQAAADVPQVCIFGSTSTNYTPPLSDKAVCIESDEKCLTLHSEK